MYQSADSYQLQLSRKRRYALSFLGFRIVRLPTNLKWGSIYLSTSNLSNTSEGATLWESYSEADGYVNTKPRKIFGQDFIRNNERLWSTIQAYKRNYSSLLEMQDEQICINQNDDFDEKKTALKCLAMTPIFGNWTLDLWKKFAKECIQKAGTENDKFKFLPVITAKAAYSFAAYNGLDEICAILWLILRPEDRLDISSSGDDRLIQVIPTEIPQEGPPVKRLRRIDAENDFVDIGQTRGTSPFRDLGRASPLPCVFARVQEENNQLMIIPEDQFGNSSDLFESETESESDDIFSMQRRRRRHDYF